MSVCCDRVASDVNLFSEQMEAKRRSLTCGEEWAEFVVSGPSDGDGTAQVKKTGSSLTGEKPRPKSSLRQGLFGKRRNQVYGR